MEDIFRTICDEFVMKMKEHVLSKSNFTKLEKNLKDKSIILWVLFCSFIQEKRLTSSFNKSI